MEVIYLDELAEGVVLSVGKTIIVGTKKIDPIIEEKEPA